MLSLLIKNVKLRNTKKTGYQPAFCEYFEYWLQLLLFNLHHEF